MTRPARNRRALLESAVTCLQRKGYARTTARDLAATAGVTLGAITYHFPSKEALLNEALAESVRRWIARVPLTGGGLAEALQAVIVGVAEHRWLAIAYLEAWAQAERSEALREQLAAQYREFRAILALATPPDADSEAIGTIAVALADGLMIQLLLDPLAVPDGERLRRGLTTTVRMLNSATFGPLEPPVLRYPRIE